MATYKVIQDIEAEDKLLGPLSLKQFIYAVIVVVCGFIAFMLGRSAWFLALPFLLPMLFFGILATPLGRDQPTEVWVIAKLRYFFKPRGRIWDQDGMQHLVTITAPKKIERALTDNLSQTEVKSRLKALASTIDSRGWVVKNTDVNLYAPPTYGPPVVDSDRLIDAASLPAQVPVVDIHPTDDILDDQNNPAARQLGQMLSVADQEHRQEMLDKMHSVQAKQAVQEPKDTGNQDLWFMNSPDPTKLPDGYTTFDTTQTVAPATPTAPISQAPSQPPANREKTPSPIPLKPDILNLARNNDRNVASLAREINKNQGLEPPDGEVVISLH
jgi:hypothetical protein